MILVSSGKSFAWFYVASVVASELWNQQSSKRSKIKIKMFNREIEIISFCHYSVTLGSYRLCSVVPTPTWFLPLLLTVLPRRGRHGSRFWWMGWVGSVGWVKVGLTYRINDPIHGTKIQPIVGHCTKTCILSTCCPFSVGQNIFQKGSEYHLKH